MLMLRDGPLNLGDAPAAVIAHTQITLEQRVHPLLHPARRRGHGGCSGDEVRPAPRSVAVTALALSSPAFDSRLLLAVCVAR